MWLSAIGCAQTQGCTFNLTFHILFTNLLTSQHNMFNVHVTFIYKFVTRLVWPCQCICDNWRMAAEFGLESAACNIEIKDKLVAQGKFTLPKLPPKKMVFDFVVLLYYRKYIAGNRLWHVPNDIWTVICTNSNPLVATSCYSMNMPCYAFLHHRHRFVGWCFVFCRVFSRNEILHPTAVILQDFLATERGMKAMETGWALIGHGGLAFGHTCSFTVHQTGRKCRWSMGNLSTEGKGMTMSDMKIRGEAVDGMLLRWHSHGYECCWLWWWCGFVVSFNALSTWARRNSLK